MSNCRYCDDWKVSAGGQCRNSPTGFHVVDEGPKRCIYCDLSYASASGECNISPTGFHKLGTVENTPIEYEASTPALIWISILTVFSGLAIPLLYIFNWNIDTSTSKTILLLAFVVSLYVGFKYAYFIIKGIGYLLGGLFLVWILYILIQWIF